MNPSDSELLTKEVTKFEIFQALQSLPSGKSPGPDGINAEFYRFFWDEVGDSLFMVVRYFF